ncbi:hypothetical protein [Haloarcula halophila]|uniref:hypothetical protein n=1 Tax=Haloarcula TaxID=2237 RepID=UPI0023E39E26|nr:hypothetical protein [Halomicroarcula sp. DFY41]
MVARGVGPVVRAAFDAVVRPRRFVAFQQSAYGDSLTATARQLASLVVVYLVNLVLYALPLTVAGVGLQQAGSPPAVFVAVAAPLLGDPAAGWAIAVAFVQNCAFITVATGITLLTFHLGVVATGGARGLVQSVHTVVYTTSAYLVALFSGVWYLTNTDGLAAARALVRNVQAAFVYWVIDLLGSSLELPGGRPDSLVAGPLTTQGRWVLALLCVTTLYYLLSLYLGARINHRTGRTDAATTVVAVALSPVLYVAGSVVATTMGLI